MSDNKLYLKVNRFELSREGKHIFIGGYIVKPDEIKNILSEFDDVQQSISDCTKITITPVMMTKEEYDKIPEFQGY